MEQSEKSTLIIKNKVNQNKFNEQEKEENNGERREWSQLPDDLLLLIASFLNFKDSLMLRSVCLEWHDTINDAIANKQFHPLPTPPFMMQKQYLKIPSLNLKTRRGINPNGSSSLIQDVDEKICYGSIEGWLVMSDDYSNNKNNLSFFFWNPVIGCRIPVVAKLNFPSKSHLERKKLNILKVVVSSKPRRNSSSCFLVVHFDDYHHIAFCKLSDESWTMIKKEDEHDLMEVEILDSKLYVRAKRCMLVYDLQDSSNGDPPKSKILTSLPIIDSPLPPLDFIVCYIIYIAKDEALGELYLIYMKVVSKFNTSPRIVKLFVYKLCLSNETSHFIKVDNLDDRVLFLDGSYNIAMSRAKFNYTQELIAANSINFLVCFPWKSLELFSLKSGVFSLTNNNINYYINETCDKSQPKRPFWFSPSLV